MKQLIGVVAVVTGASSGIGKAIAELYAEEGATVVLVSRNQEKLDLAVSGITALGGNATSFAADVTSEADVANLFATVLEKFGRVDVLINNAGVTTRLPTVELPAEDWKRVIDVNVTGAFLCSKAALQIMKKNQSGRIINIGSVAAKAPRQHAIAYSTSKSALEGLTRSLALDAREYGVTASLIQPGNTQSELWTERGALAAKEGIMSARDVARVAVLMAALPADVNLYEAVIHPIRMPWMGRG